MLSNEQRDILEKLISNDYEIEKFVITRYNSSDYFKEDVDVYFKNKIEIVNMKMYDYENITQEIETILSYKRIIEALKDQENN